jgi:hypothetical protein
MAEPEEEETPEEGTGASTIRLILIVVGVISVILSAMFTTFYLVKRTNTLQFVRTGTQTKGEVAKIDWSRTGGAFIVAYKFKDKENAPRTGTDEYPFPDGKDLKVGESIDIVYLPHSKFSRIWRTQVLMMEEVEHVPWIKVLVSAAIGAGSLWTAFKALKKPVPIEE